ncbi:hypothetical protein KHQ81_04570 [Mycoplasmatota bacterium]|nr:hypothetical protein KHQ81_04570 [Mycoplasmatota bacterium]
MKKKIIIFSLVISIVGASIGGYLLGKKSTTISKTESEESYVYYCILDGPGVLGSVWVDPEYNDYPKYYTAKTYSDEYNYTLEPDWISCEKVYQH